MTLTLDSAARVRARLGSIAHEYPFESRYFELAVGRIHYVDEGPRDADPILFLHGNPTWSFAFRRLIAALRATERCVALDHLGCGLSDKPEDWTYDLAHHAENVLALVQALDLERITLVMHDWGGAIGMAFARRAPKRIARLLVMNTAAFRSTRMPLRIRVCRAPALGPFLVTRLNAFARLASRMALADPRLLSDAARAGFLLPYDTPAHRIAIQRFIEDIPLTPAHPSWRELVTTEDALAQFQDRPTTIVWGERDWCFTPHFRREWERRFPRARSIPIAHAGHFVFEEAPRELESALRDLVREPRRAER